MVPGSIPTPKSNNTTQAHPRIHPIDPLRVWNDKFQPLPKPIGTPPYHYDTSKQMPIAFTAPITTNGKMVVNILGDSGGVKEAKYQVAVANQLAKGNANFLYHLGDIVYFNGSHDDYYSQFYEPYAHYNAPIFAIPGNHDGEVDTPTDVSLSGWVDYFMQANPGIDPISKDAPRVQMNLPNPYWTLITPYATIVGLYTNVPEGGSVDSTQLQWFINELATAPTDRALIVTMHHPIISFDDVHSGSSKMGLVLENAIRATGRVPNLVLSGHVHDYQRIEKEITKGVQTPFIVNGNGGYHILHPVSAPVGSVAKDTGAVLKYVADKAWGYLTLTIDKTTITGSTTEIDHNGNVLSTSDSFSYSAAPVTMAAGENVPVL